MSSVTDRDEHTDATRRPDWDRLAHRDGPVPESAAWNVLSYLLAGLLGFGLPAWLLDQCPPEYRGHAPLTKHPLLLVRLTARHVAAQHAGAQAARAALRADLSGYLPSAVVAEGLEVLDVEQRRLDATAQAVQLVERALRGQVFVPRL